MNKIDKKLLKYEQTKNMENKVTIKQIENK